MNIFKNLFNRCCDAVVIVNEQAELTYANALAWELLGDPFKVLTAPPGQAQGKLWEQQQGRLIEQQRSLLQTVMACQPVLSQDFLLRRSPTGAWLAVTTQAFHLPNLDFHGWLLLIHEVGQSPDNSDWHSSLASRDVLTCWINRTILLERIQQALQQSQQHQQAGIAILCVDITRLKAINDTFGYLAGDRLLVEIVHRLSNSLRPNDTIARLGGDEFIVLAEDVATEAAAIAIAEALHAQMVTPFAINGYELNIGLNIGISLSHPQLVDADTLLRQADRAMTDVKQHFGERYRIFAGELTPSSEDALHLEMSLKQAIDNGELYLEYQPMVLVRTQEIVGMESLVRWQHPEQGVITPSQFINIAERTGLIIPLGWWVLEESCRQLKVWQETIPQAQNLFMSVNMSRQQFAQPDVLDRIKTILQRTQLSPEFLKIEMTEGVLIENSESIIEILAAIRDLGIRLSVDDFGTGYSSLSYLHRFPVDTLKIDRSFLENADSDYEKLEILQSVVRLAWNLGLEVVAEGIETQKHLAQVQALRCESGQGFLFSRPLDQTAMAAILRSRSTAS